MIGDKVCVCGRVGCTWGHGKLFEIAPISVRDRERYSALHRSLRIVYYSLQMLLQNQKPSAGHFSAHTPMLRVSRARFSAYPS